MEVINRIKRYYRRHSYKETIKWIKDTVVFQLKEVTNKPVQYKKLKLKKNEIPKRAKKVFIFAKQPFFALGGTTRAARLSRTFNEMGIQVCYIYAFDTIDKDFYKKNMPLCMHINIKRISLKYFEKMVYKDDVVIFELPLATFFPYLEIALDSMACVIYESINNWESSLGDNFLLKKFLYKTIRFANELTVTTENLVGKVKGYCKKLNVLTDIKYVPNGVDNKLFNIHNNYSCPKDLVIKSKTLLYYGTLDKNIIDWELINNIAINNLDWAINIIGNNYYYKDSKYPNIYFLGEKQYEEMPAYIKYSDYVIIPYLINDITNYMSFPEIPEANAMGKRVISTKISNINEYPNVYTGNDWQSWMDITKMDYKFDLLSAKSLIDMHSWPDITQDMINHMPYYRDISIIILFNSNIDHLKKCLESILKRSTKYDYEIIVVGKFANNQLINYKNKVKTINCVSKDNSTMRSKAMKHVTKKYVMFLNANSLVTDDRFLDSYLDIISFNFE